MEPVKPTPEELIRLFPWWSRCVRVGFSICALIAIAPLPVLLLEWSGFQSAMGPLLGGAVARAAHQSLFWASGLLAVVPIFAGALCIACATPPAGVRKVRRFALIAAFLLLVVAGALFGVIFPTRLFQVVGSSLPASLVFEVLPALALAVQSVRWLARGVGGARLARIAHRATLFALFVPLSALATLASAVLAAPLNLGGSAFFPQTLWVLLSSSMLVLPACGTLFLVGSRLLRPPASTPTWRSWIEPLLWVVLAFLLMLPAMQLPPGSTQGVLQVDSTVPSWARNPSRDEVFAACCVVWLAALPFAAIVMWRGWRVIAATILALIIAVVFS